MVCTVVQKKRGSRCLGLKVRKKRKKVKEIVKTAKESPDEINKKIEDLFGFTSDS